MAIDMRTQTTHPSQHDHIFGQDRVRPGERRTLWVIAITMIVAGILALAFMGFSGIGANVEKLLNP